MSIVEELVEKIGNITLMDAVNLRKTLEEKFNVSAQNISTISVYTPVITEVEKSSFALHLISLDVTKRINVIKTIKSALDIPLTEAKAITDSLPKLLKDDLSKDESEKIAKELRDSGAVIEIK
jgi:large subunit ribosomal protein L7/L12